MGTQSVNEDDFFIEYDPTSTPDGQVTTFNYKDKPVVEEIQLLIQRISKGESYLILRDFSWSVFSKIAEIKADNFKNRTVNDFFERTKSLGSTLLYPDPFHFSILIAKPVEVLLLEFLLEWCKTKEKYLHKGTPLFWAGEWHLIKGDLDMAFTHFIEAIEEDKNIEPDEFRKRAAYQLMSLCDQDNHAWAYIKKYSDKLNSYFKEYSTVCGSNFSRSEFNIKFLLNNQKEVESLKLYFSRTFIQIGHLMEESNGHYENDLVSLVGLLYFTSLIIILENILKSKWKNKPALRDKNEKREMARDLEGYVLAMCSEKKWLPDNYTKTDNAKFNTTYNQWHQDKAIFESMCKLELRDLHNNKISPFYAILTVARIFRNAGAHGVSSIRGIAANLECMIKIACFSLFIAVEYCYDSN